MTEPLFCHFDLSRILSEVEQAMLKEIGSLNENRVLNTSHEDLRDYFIKKYSKEMPQVDELAITVDQGDAQIDVSRRFEYAVFDRSQPLLTTGTRITFYLPFVGDSQLFHCKASTFSLNPPRAAVRNDELQFVYERTTSDAEKIKQEFQDDLNRFKQSLSWIQKDLTQFNSSIKQTIEQEINARRNKLLHDRSLVASLGYPLRTREGRSRTYVTPEVRRIITPQLPPVSEAPYQLEPVLEIENYEHILSVLTNMTTTMELSPKAFSNMGEEHLRTHFLVQLNGHFEGQATAETFNYEGKTDILLRVQGKNIFIAECKFWSGPERFKEAIDQLLSYTSWRDTKTALLIFNRNTNMSTVLERILQAVKEHPSYKAEQEYNSETGFRYIFGHRDDPTRELYLTVLVFNVPQ